MRRPVPDTDTPLIWILTVLGLLVEALRAVHVEHFGSVHVPVVTTTESLGFIAATLLVTVWKNRLIHSEARRSASDRRSAAAITAGACIRPGWRESRSIGPDTDTAAMTLPEGERTGAETDATPCSRSPTLCAQPRRRTPASAAALNEALWRPRCMRSGSSHASRICAADPAPMVSWLPTGTVSRSPDGRSAAATHTR